MVMHAQQSPALSPEAFVQAWPSSLVCLPASTAIPAAADPAAIDFLRRAGLPRGVCFGITGGALIHLSFAPLERGLSAATRDLRVDSPDWPGHFVLGEIEVEGACGGVLLLHGPSGRVDGLDLDAERLELTLVNTNVACLV